MDKTSMLLEKEHKKRLADKEKLYTTRCKKPFKNGFCTGPLGHIRPLGDQSGYVLPSKTPPLKKSKPVKKPQKFW